MTNFFFNQNVRSQPVVLSKAGSFFNMEMNFHYPKCTAISLATKSDKMFGAKSAQPTHSSACDPYFCQSMSNLTLPEHEQPYYNSMIMLKAKI
jgi:hypothetical protein